MEESAKWFVVRPTEAANARENEVKTSTWKIFTTLHPDQNAPIDDEIYILHDRTELVMNRNGPKTRPLRPLIERDLSTRLKENYKLLRAEPIELAQLLCHISSNLNLKHVECITLDFGYDCPAFPSPYTRIHFDLTELTNLKIMQLSGVNLANVRSTNNKLHHLALYNIWGTSEMEILGINHFKAMIENCPNLSHLSTDYAPNESQPKLKNLKTFIFKGDCVNPKNLAAMLENTKDTLEQLKLDMSATSAFRVLNAFKQRRTSFKKLSNLDLGLTEFKPLFEMGLKKMPICRSIFPKMKVITHTTPNDAIKLYNSLGFVGHQSISNILLRPESDENMQPFIEPSGPLRQLIDELSQGWYTYTFVPIPTERFLTIQQIDKIIKRRMKCLQKIRQPPQGDDDKVDLINMI